MRKLDTTPVQLAVIHALDGPAPRRYSITVDVARLRSDPTFHGALAVSDDARAATTGFGRGEIRAVAFALRQLADRMLERTEPEFEVTP